MKYKRYDELSLEQLSSDRHSLAELVSDCRMYREALDAIREPIMIYDENRRMLIGNTTHEQEVSRLDMPEVRRPEGLSGMSAEEIRDALSASPMARQRPTIGEEWYQAHSDAWQRSLDSGEMVEIQYTDNTWHLMGVQQTASGYYVDHRASISSQKKSLEDLRQVLDTTDQGICVTDEVGQIIALNPAVIELWGLEGFAWQNGKKIKDLAEYSRRAGVIGSQMDELEWADYLADIENAYGHADWEDPGIEKLDTGKYVRRVRRVLPNGYHIHLHYDVTEFEQQKEALEMARRDAEMAERAKSEFLANMSHEIRTPMNGVMGMAELLSRTELDSKQRSFADTIVKSSEALLTIINDILDFSKIDAGQMTLMEAPFNLIDAIEDIATLVSSAAVEKNIELAVRFSPSLPRAVIGDVGRLRQVITNLVGNAVKFTEEGHVLIDVSGERTQLEDGTLGTTLRVQIEDTGIGIPENKLNAIFEKFSQVDGTAARRHEGTGLGLAISSSLVDLMGGQIGVQSVEGEGSTFWFEIQLPVDEVHPREKVAPTDVSGARVLIIDDNQVNRAILLEQMEAWKFEAKAVPSGPEGVKLLTAGSLLDMPFDALILDYHMPGQTGADVAADIRGNAAIADTPIVMLTSVDQAASNEKFDGLEIDGFLTKPARSSLLLETLVDVLQASAARRQSAPQVAATTSSIPPVVNRSTPALAEPVSALAPMPETPVVASPVSGGQPDNAAQPLSPTPAKLTVDSILGAPPVQTEATVAPAPPPLTPAAAARPSTTPATASAAPKASRQPVVSATRTLSRSPTGGGAYKVLTSKMAPKVDILIAEDNEINQVVFSQSLKGDTDYSFKIAPNGEEAVKKFRELNPKIILMDVSMPIMNGMEATAAIRAYERDTERHTPIIGITAHAIDGDREKCLAGGMDDYLSKPISPQMLIDKVNEWMERAEKSAAVG